MILPTMPTHSLHKHINYSFLLTCLATAAALTAAILLATTSKSAVVAGSAFAGKTLVATSVATATAASSFAFFPVALVLLGVAGICSLVPLFCGGGNNRGWQQRPAMGTGYDGHQGGYRAAPLRFWGENTDQQLGQRPVMSYGVPSRSQHGHANAQASHVHTGGSSHRHGH